MLVAWDKYAVFDGCSSRSEFWLFWLLSIMTAFAAGFLDQIIGYVFFLPIYVLVFSVPHVSVCIRRLHDLNRSGWWIILSFLPILSLLFLIYMCFPGEEDRGVR